MQSVYSKAPVDLAKPRSNLVRTLVAMLFHFRTNTHGDDIILFITPVMGYLKALLFFNNDCFGVKQPTKSDMPLNKTNKQTNKY